MADHVDIDQEVVAEVVRDVRAGGDDWDGAAGGLVIAGVSSELAESSATQVTEWQRELRMAAQGFGELADRIERQAATFAELDRGLVTSSGSPMAQRAV